MRGKAASMAAVPASIWWKVGAISGAISIGTGAFGAHALKSQVSDPKMIKTWETASHYQVNTCTVFRTDRGSSISYPLAIVIAFGCVISNASITKARTRWNVIRHWDLHLLWILVCISFNERNKTRHVDGK